MGNTKSTQLSKEPKNYPNCECTKHAESGAYYNNEKRCMSFEGHNCICKVSYWNREPYIYITNNRYCQANEHPCLCQNGIKKCKAAKHKCICTNYETCNASKHKCICYNDHRLYKRCQANTHYCICLLHGPNNCEATKNHPCSCRKNYKNVKREEHLGNCKAMGNHPCLCKFNKSKCQACY